MAFNFKSHGIVIGLLMFFSLNACAQNKYDPNDRSWVAEANKNIDKYRKGDLTVTVTDKNGNPITGASVQIRQVKQAFYFGAHIEGKNLLSKQDTMYQHIVKSHYNLVVPADFQWTRWNNPKSADNNRKLALKVLDWCHSNDIAVKGHYLVWTPMRPYYLLNSIMNQEGYSSPAMYKQTLLSYVQSVVTATQGKIEEWDTFNHLAARNQKDQMVDSRNRKMLIDDYLGNDIFNDVIQTEKSIDPKPKLYVNDDQEFTTSNLKKSLVVDYYDRINYLKSQNLPIDGIGFMSHFKGSDLISMEYIKSVLTKYSNLNMPMKITEFDVSFGSGEKNDNYIMTDADLQLQKQFTEDFMRLCYSIPRVNGFITWGFWEKDDWIPSAAFYNADWTIKPNGQAWDNLVLKEWRTNTSGTTNSSGVFSIRGFLGDYNIKVSKNGASAEKTNISLDKSGKTIIIQLM